MIISMYLFSSRFALTLHWSITSEKNIWFWTCFYLCCLLGKAMAPHSSTLAWKIPWMEEPGRLRSMGLLRVGQDWVTSLSRFTFMHWRRQWQPTPVFLPGESQGWEPGGLPSMGSHRVRHDRSDLAAAACCLLIVSSAFTITYRNFQLGFKTSPLIDMGYVCQESPWQCC